MSPSIADTSDEVYGRVMPAVGLMYRYPFVAKTWWGTHIIEPVAQVIARPNETSSLRVANEDAQSLVFDDTNLFEWNGKFSGYDRVEGGTRANVGALYTGRFGNRGLCQFPVRTILQPGRPQPIPAATCSIPASIPASTRTRRISSRGRRSRRSRASS